MKIVRKINDVWTPVTGRVTLDRMTATATLHYADGRTASVKVDPYPVTETVDTGKVAQMIAEGVWTQADLDPYGLKVASDFVYPSDKIASGVPRYEEQPDGSVHEVYDLADPVADPEPEPERPRVAKSTVLARLTDEQLAAVKALWTPREEARWYSPDHPAVYADDPDVIRLLSAVGADPAFVLAV